MTALSDFTLPLLISSSDPLHITSSLIILIGRFVGGHLKDDHTQENHIKGLGNSRIQRGKKENISHFRECHSLHFQKLIER